MNGPEMLDELAFRYHLLFTRLVADGPFRGTPLKTVEAWFADKVRAALFVGHPFDGRTKVYGPTPRAARLRGVSAKKYANDPSAQTILQDTLIFQFCEQGPVRRKRLTPAEFAEKFPTLATAKGVCRSRYYIDRREAQPRVAVMVPDFGTDYFRVATKAVKAIQKRKEHEPFRTFLYNSLFVVTVITGFEHKASRIRESLAERNLPCPVEVEVVPGVADFLMRGDGDE